MSDPVIDALMADKTGDTASTDDNASTDGASSNGQPADTSESSARDLKSGDAAGTEKGEDGTDKNPLSKEDFQSTLASRLTLGKTEPETPEVLRRQRAESAKEAKRLKAELDGRDQFFAERYHLKPVSVTRDGQKVTEFVADKDYVAKTAVELAANIDVKLTKAQEDKLLDDPQAVVAEVKKQVLDAAVAALGTNAGPTALAQEAELPEAAINAIHTELVNAKVGDEPLMADYDLLETSMDSVIERDLPDALVDLMSRDEDVLRTMMLMTHGYVRNQAGDLLQSQRDAQKAAKEKQDRAAGDISLTGAGSGGAEASGKVGSGSLSKAQQEILDAEPQF